MVKVRFSSTIQSAVNNDVETQSEFSGTVLGLLEKLAGKYGENFKKRIYGSDGKPRKFINIYLNGKDIRFKEGGATRVGGKDEVDLIPAVSGG